MRQLLVLALAAAVLSPARTTTAQSPAPSTGRVLGILDAATGQPLEGAEVIDRISNTSAITTKSGLVGLGSFSKQHDSSVVTVRKIGYQDTTFLAMQNDTTPITLMLEHAVPVLPAILSKAMISKSDLEETASYTDALFIPPGVLRSPALKGKSLGDALRAFKMIGQFESKDGKIADEPLPRSPDSRQPGADPGATQCYVKIVLNWDVAAGRGVNVDDLAATYDGALFYPKGRPLPEEFMKFTGCGGTLLLWTMAR
ncbi:MAG TPA: hypothetical protein VGM67_00625 [Gemmatimonadaceae bacterium]|jgi:hypothetical protein